MALVTTPGAANADSYAALAEADAYCAAMGVSGWTGADALKEAALRRATAWLDATYGAKWPGYRANRRNQSLDWPRRDAYDAEGDWIDSATVPVEVKNACCEAAARELATPGSLTPDVVVATMVKSEQVGPLSVSYVGAASVDALKPVLTVVDGILRNLMTSAGSLSVGYLDRA